MASFDSHASANGVGSHGKATSRNMGSRRIEILAEKEISELMKNLDLTPLQVEEIRTCFDLFDIHGTGAISTVELQRAAHSVGRELTEEDVTEIIAEIDENDKGEIDFIDFLTVMGKITKEPLQEADVEHVFNTFDQNGDTFISPEDLHRTFLTLGVDLTPGEVNTVFEKYDEDRDGLMNFEEFSILVEKAHEQIAAGFGEAVIEDQNK